MSAAPRQTRTRCVDCRREVVFRHTDRVCGPHTNCFACGSPNLERVEFEGYFDIDTQPDVIARAGLTLDDRDHARLAPASVPPGSRLDQCQPPLTLVVEVEDHVVMHGE